MRQTTLISIALAGAALAPACGGKKDGGGAAAGPGAGPAAVDPRAELAAADKLVPPVDALVPEALKARLAFGAQLVSKDRAVALLPRGWSGDQLGVRPPEEAGLGFMTRMDVDSNCDGACSPKPWAEVADKVDFAQFKRADFTVDKDESLDGGRVLVAHTADRAYVVAAFWKEGASRYFTCHATLDQEVKDAAPAFEAACRAVKVLSWQ